jgi:hypothetical protein
MLCWSQINMLRRLQINMLCWLQINTLCWSQINMLCWSQINMLCWSQMSLLDQVIWNKEAPAAVDGGYLLVSLFVSFLCLFFWIISYSCLEVK